MKILSTNISRVTIIKPKKNKFKTYFMSLKIKYGRKRNDWLIVDKYKFYAD